MADETRRQRRDARRAADAQSGPGGRVTPQAAAAGGGGGGDAIVEVGGAGGGRRRFGFVHESVAELRKVEWPTRAQVIQGTVVVIVACAVVGLFLYLADLGLKPLVRDVFLND